MTDAEIIKTLQDNWSGYEAYGISSKTAPAIQALFAKERISLLEEVKERLGKMKKTINNRKFIGDEFEQIEVQRDMGYNEALDDVLTSLEKKE